MVSIRLRTRRWARPFIAASFFAPIILLALWASLSKDHDHFVVRRLDASDTNQTDGGGDNTTVQCFGPSCLAVVCNDTAGATAADCEVDTGGVTKKPSTLEFALCAFGLFYMFVALYIVCDEFFVPSLDKISGVLGLSSDVAGATFMAAGGSAPEFCTSMIGALSPTPSDVGIAAIVGSAVFNVLFVIGACGLAATETLQLTGYPLGRDCTFYLVDLGVMVWAFWDAQICWYEALILFILYVLYCVFMAFSARFQQWIGMESTEDCHEDAVPSADAEAIGNKEDPSKAREIAAISAHFEDLDVNHDGSLSLEEAGADPELREHFDEIDEDHDGSITLGELRRWKLRSRRNQKSKRELDSDESEESAEPEEDSENEPMTLAPPEDGTVMDWIWYVLTFPLVLALVITVPDVRRDGCWSSLYIPGFILSIAWIAVFSKFMVSSSEVVGAFTGIDPGILALTLLAWGTSVPDLLTSVLVTLQGHGDMAVSSSIGSNIFDVTVGLPVPWLLFAMLNNGRAVQVGNGGLIVSIGMLVAMVAFTIGSICINRWKLNKVLGLLMIILWVAFQAYSIYSFIQAKEEA